MFGDPGARRAYVARAAHCHRATDDAVLEQIGAEVAIGQRSAQNKFVGREGPAGDLQRVAVLIGPAPRHFPEWRPETSLAGHALANRGAVILGALPVLNAMATAEHGIGLVGNVASGEHVGGGRAAVGVDQNAAAVISRRKV